MQTILTAIGSAIRAAIGAAAQSSHLIAQVRSAFRLELAVIGQRLGVREPMQCPDAGMPFVETFDRLQTREDL
ncbi:hypothetical protein [Rhodopseudomonas palustris]|uniref:hypothetical protein n=1 Tax=Rhodopseudomonas palustris TaxID=1076 RepID=UPI0012EDEEE8